jgi:hypothetical protein
LFHQYLRKLFINYIGIIIDENKLKINTAINRIILDQKLYSKYNIDGKLSTDSKVLEGGSFTDTGHLPGEAWGSGFVSETGSEYGLSFYVDENSTTSPINSVYEPTNSKSQRFDLVPMSKEFKDILGISTPGDHMIFHMEGGRKQGYCVVSSNPPSEEFKNELVSNWGLNNDLF